MGVCDRLGAIVAVDAGLGASATGDWEARGTAAAVGEAGVTVAAVGITVLTVVAVGETGEGDGSESQLKVTVAKSRHTNASLHGHRMIFKKVVVGI